MNRPLYLDTNIFIAAFEMSQTMSDHAWRILDDVNAGSVWAITIELILAELLPKPLRTGDRELGLTYESLIRSSGHLDVAPVTRSILVCSADMRASQSSFEAAGCHSSLDCAGTWMPCLFDERPPTGTQADLQSLYLGETSLEEANRLTA